MVEKGHRSYGHIFRLGPRQIWVSEKAAMKAILQTVDLPKVNIPGMFKKVQPGPHQNCVDKLGQFFSLCVGSLVENTAIKHAPKVLFRHHEQRE
ncbi:hypothetical protein N8T08_010954 [Aspergillus melleus]|uniref:Uncharacterized protein n=1 Tax=Aspergillus melleus TaxID=138277 RepID=A0ACC3AQW9_9EURO|nr:hypothetical protein N8T08_010954 [Aspergillus melleus]